MTPSTRALLMRGLLSAGLTAATLTATLPAAAHAAPAQSAAALTAALAAPAEYEDKLKVAVKFGLGDQPSLLEKSDRDFVVALWNHLKGNPDHLEVTAAAATAFSAPENVDDACSQFILVDVYAAFDRDLAREKQEDEAKRESDKARAAAAASISVVADAAMLNGTDAKFAELIWKRVENDANWPKVKAAAAAAMAGTPEQQREFIAAGLAAAAKQDTDDIIARDQATTEAQKAAARARAAKQFAANRVGMTPTDQLLNMPDRDFVTEVWNHTPEGSEVQAAAIRAARSNDPAVWKAFIDTGIHQAKDRDIQIALEKRYQADRAEADRVKKLATANGDNNLLRAATKALAGSPDELAEFLRVGQYDMNLTTGFEAGDVQPTWSDSPVSAGYVANVSGAELRVRDEAGHGGKAALVYAGSDDNTLQSHAYLRSMALSRVKVKPTTTLSYWIYPQSSTAKPGVKTRNSTCVAIDLAFSDGSTLRDSGLTDQRGNRVHPAHQCSKLTADKWNRVVVKLGGAFAGKQITAVHVGYDQSNNIGGYRGLIDDITITDKPIDNSGDGNGPAPDYPADKPVRDFNSDGKADVFVRKADGTLRLYRGDGKGYWIDAANSPVIGTGWGKFTAVFSPGDFNGDGLLDVIARNAAGDLLLYRGNGKGSWIDPSSNIKIGSGWDNFTAVFSPGDFNGDGNSDVIVRKADGTLRLYRGDGKGYWIDAANSPVIGTGWSKFTAVFSPGDFNGDGFADVIARNADGDLLLYRGNGKGSWIDPSSNIKIGTGWHRFTTVFSPGDFNGDGFADVIARNADGDLLLYRGNGKGSWIDPSSNIKIGSGWNSFNLIF
ncbi:FG-GAP-like repeat-containing protein [Couchioplanes azureus]|uniref:FG-GAP-like repeat-containing protein n=1 Tax=Couchioplanes caeruleus TaxID=56438 RepID=UPI0016704150|nr:FG-GAP-like repeat-containing protein [Couchioplanes caeruleus]GGQ67685.1 hypothetical protein GCM10010166_42090 [Couchioplanes caeruleus subsp. azureus]